MGAIFSALRSPAPLRVGPLRAALPSVQASENDAPSRANAASRSHSRFSVTSGSNTIPDDVAAFPGAVAAGHGGDETTRFTRQSTGRISPSPSYKQRPSRRSDSRLSTAQLQAMSSRRSSEWTSEAWDQLVEGLYDEEDEEDGFEIVSTASPPLIDIQRKGSLLVRMEIEAAEAADILQPSSGESLGPEDGSPDDGAVNAAAPAECLADSRCALLREEVAQAQAFAPQARAAMARMQKAMGLGHKIEGDDLLPLPQAICGTFSVAGIDDGVPKTNQDCAAVAYPLQADPDAGLFVVLDGHGERGDVVSNELLLQLHERIGAQAWGSTNAVGETALALQMVDAFEGAHRRLADFACDEHGVSAGTQSGAAAVALLLRHGRLLLAHCGDCRAVLGTLAGDDEESLHAVELTRDHKLDSSSPGEVERVLAAGAWIRPGRLEPYFLPPRVFADEHCLSKGPGLTMARSLGDSDGDDAGVIPTPEVTFRQLDARRDRFIVLASDGVWEFLSSEEVVEIVGGFLQRGEPAIVAARFLIARAALAWRAEEGDYRDDITAIVLMVQDLPPELLRPLGFQLG